MNDVAASSVGKAPLEDVMIAMDVVDTIRHRQLIVDRELDSEARRERMLQRLREIYAAQGIEVTDDALQAGVAALEEERFRYDPPNAGLGTRLAKIYVRRDRWLRPVTLLSVLVAVVWLGWHMMVSLPKQQFEDALPGQINATYVAISSQATGENAIRAADEYLTKARAALADENFSLAQEFHAEMKNLHDRLQGAYEIRIISRPNQLSGVWRVPSVNESARNYYLIVEAVTATGRTVAVPIRNEEDGETRTVSTWGVRVDADTFEAVAADKRDDGIIQGEIIGNKPAGRIEPEYSINTTGATITEW